MTYFRYDQSILSRYPNIVGGIIAARGVTNPPAAQPLAVLYEAQQAMTKAQLAQVGVSDLLSIAAWRAAFRGFGVDPTQYRCAAEALLRRLSKQGDIPSINTLVDIGNLVSIRYGIPIAVFDAAGITGGLSVRFSDGSERFDDLGSSATVHPAVGEVIFCDEAGTVHARRWCWRQSAQSAARATTRDVIITVEAHHADGREDVQGAVQDLLALLSDYADGAAEHALLDTSRPEFATEVG